MQEDTEQAKRDAIEKLHRRDAEASRTGDFDTLLSLWTDDAVMLPPEGPPVVGIDAIRKLMLRGRDQRAAIIVTEYVQDFQELLILGDTAFEWGTYHGASRPSAGGAEEASSGKLMRLLRRQPDGAWKVARSIWTVDRSAAD